ncbi:MAG TPA: sigma-70 family RNA polymerase sigma factor [Nevskiaceae bacterium]|nr:sigma-70 family RNA polymerase sigma factor [Nevskiaceae bacterium]
MNSDESEQRDSLVLLLRQSGGHSQSAFANLYQRTAPKLYGLCLRMLRESAEAEDALQDVYLAIWRHAASFDPGRAAPMTWLIAIARNQCIDRLRRHREVQLADGVAEELADPAPEPSDLGEASQDRQRLEHCLDTLAIQQKSAVRAAFFTGATYNELAIRQGVPLATLKSWIRRGLIRLRSCLES